VVEGPRLESLGFGVSDFGFKIQVVEGLRLESLEHLEVEGWEGNLWQDQCRKSTTSPWTWEGTGNLWGGNLWQNQCRGCT